MENNEEQKPIETKTEKVDYGNSRIDMKFTNASGMVEGETESENEEKKENQEIETERKEEEELNKNINEEESVLNNPTNPREAPSDVKEEEKPVLQIDIIEEAHDDIPEKGSVVPASGAAVEMRY